MIRTEWVTGRTVRIKEGWQDAGKRGVILCKPVRIGQTWIAVLWDDEEEPDWFKQRGLEIVTGLPKRGKRKSERLAETAAEMRAAGEVRREEARRFAANTRWHGREEALRKLGEITG
ncbi:MAG TPA: hypothetical protein VNO24_10885 [Blastocatellia bacterium]|nr:hypothetical protein [Blastocatellia bacterium]